MIARRKVIEEMAESVKTCLSDVQPNLGVVARQNTVRGRSGSISYQVWGMFDSGCQRFEDVIVDLNDVPGQPLVSVTVQRGNGVQMMTERVVRLDNHEPPMPNTIDFVQFLTAMREELADQLSQPFNIDDEMPNWVAGRIASRVQELTPSAHPELHGHDDGSYEVHISVDGIDRLAFSVEDRRRPLAEALLTTHVDVTVHGETGIIKSPIVVRADHDIMSPEETITATEMLAQLR